MNVPHIVIIGGGFGGVYTARFLEPLVRKGLADVTIVSRNNYFLFTPLLHEVATGALSPNSVTEPIREIFRGDNVHFIQAEVKTIDTEKKSIKTSLGQISYDYLVVGSGASTNYYGIPGAEKYSLQLKDLQDAVNIRNAIIKACEKAAATTDIEERRRLLSVAIVGGGATGVELATELVEFMKKTLCSYYHHACFDQGDMTVNLIATSTEVLPMFPPKIRTIALDELKKAGVVTHLGMMVNEVMNHELKVKDVAAGTDSVMHAQTIIWVAGVAASTWEIPNTEKERGNRIKIDELLRVVGHPEIFSIGDTSGTLPMLAQVASQQARALARNIAAVIEKKPAHMKPFVYKPKGMLISLGQWSAAGEIYGHTFKGPLMWWMWRTIYLFNFHSWKKRFRIAAEWTMDIFSPRDISTL
jgi:NADH:ubiquinone reductase (H+-translocating)